MLYIIIALLLLGLSFLAGMMGLGVAFIATPVLGLFGFDRLAAATNSVIVTLPSFSAFATHLPDARFDWTLLILTSIAAVIGAQAGANFMAKRVKSLTLSRVFATALVLLAAQRIWVLMV